MMKTTATELRANLFSFLDSLIETGEPIEIERRGVKLRISRGDGGPRLSRLGTRATLACAPEELLGLDWSGEWKP